MQTKVEDFYFAIGEDKPLVIGKRYINVLVASGFGKRSIINHFKSLSTMEEMVDEENSFLERVANNCAKR